MEVDYRRLREIYRRELASTSRPTRVEPDFYDLLADYIRKEREEFQRAWQTHNIPKIVEFANMVSLVEQIIAIRQRKVVMLAMTNMADEGIEPENLVGWERDMYDEILSTIRKYRDEAKRFLRLVEGEQKPAEEQVLNLVRIKILEDLPQFVGPDMEKYGPYSKGDVVELPSEIVDILLIRKVAEVVKGEENPHA